VHTAPLYNGGGVIQEYSREAGPDQRNGQLTDREARAWHLALDLVTTDVAELGPGPVHTVFGFRHRLVNINSVELEQLLEGGPVLPLAMINPVEVPNDEQAMTDYLTTGPGGPACLLLTARGLTSEFEPIVDADLMSQAGRRAGFVRTTTIDLPDGRTVVVWRRPATCPVTAAPAA